jgi:hypothetical protein
VILCCIVASSRDLLHLKTVALQQTHRTRVGTVQVRVNGLLDGCMPPPHRVLKPLLDLAGVGTSQSLAASSRAAVDASRSRRTAKSLDR